MRQYSLKYARANPEKKRQYNLKRRYKVTPEFVDGYQFCELSGEPFGETRSESPAVDHCHKTNEFRGVIKHKYNWAIGVFGDDPAKLRLAVDYLEARQW